MPRTLRRTEPSCFAVSRSPKTRQPLARRDENQGPRVLKLFCCSPATALCCDCLAIRACRWGRPLSSTPVRTEDGRALKRCLLQLRWDLSGSPASAVPALPQDPLHSVAARDAVDKKAGVYEAVNKPQKTQSGGLSAKQMSQKKILLPVLRSRSKFYIGMHNEPRGCSTRCCNYTLSE